jgi:hypothetical protein
LTLPDVDVRELLTSLQQHIATARRTPNHGLEQWKDAVSWARFCSGCRDTNWTCVLVPLAKDCHLDSLPVRDRPSQK